LGAIPAKVHSPVHDNFLTNILHRHDNSGGGLWQDGRVQPAHPMKKILLPVLAAALLLGAVFAATSPAAPFTVHEWGTFTSVSGSDGVMLPGLEAEEERLPPFVRTIDGLSPFYKGISRPVRNVTVKMETPVLYFYSPVARSARVEVDFVVGSISQWYPERAEGETLAPAAGQPFDPSPINFAAGRRGRAVWQVEVLPPGMGKITAPRLMETPQWPRARVLDANLVRGPNGPTEGESPDKPAEGPVVENFIFYRGLGNFALPLKAMVAPGGALMLRNTGKEDISYVLVEWVPDNIGWMGALRAGGSVAPKLAALGEKPHDKFKAALVDAGLTAAEAAALLATWEESYFGKPGLRVFWIVPRAFTDRVLPIKITPAPDKLERVLVGRTEVLTPEFEAWLARDFAADDGKKWESDRYYRSYLARLATLAAKRP
jgi:hypothetical protein